MQLPVAIPATITALCCSAAPTSNNSRLSKGYIGAHRPTLSIFAAADLDELLDI
jgi:hypothetical protein